MIFIFGVGFPMFFRLSRVQPSFEILSSKTLPVFCQIITSFKIFFVSKVCVTAFQNLQDWKLSFNIYFGVNFFIFHFLNIYIFNLFTVFM